MTFQDIVDLLTEEKVIRLLGCTHKVFYTKLRDFAAPNSPEDWGAIEDISVRLGIDKYDLKFLLEMVQREKAALERIKEDRTQQRKDDKKERREGQKDG